MYLFFLAWAVEDSRLNEKASSRNCNEPLTTGDFLNRAIDQNPAVCD
jgi:hypothetical protein